MKIKVIKGRDLRAGMTLALPFQKTAAVTENQVGRVYNNFRTMEYGKSRVMLEDEVLIAVSDDWCD